LAQGILKLPFFPRWQTFRLGEVLFQLAALPKASADFPHPLLQNIGCRREILD